LKPTNVPPPEELQKVLEGEIVRGVAVTHAFFQKCRDRDGSYARFLVEAED
jgi:hypothetical protein